jgi:PhzF family phenazine biosynthesis protein
MTLRHIHRFHQLDVFTAQAMRGNPLAVVHEAASLSDETMADFARWTNLSETTFLLPPTDPAADYRVRIFTPGGELPFAGHPTLGSCQAWLWAGGQPRQPDVVVQECGVGQVRIRRDGTRLAFAAPPLRRTGPLEASHREALCAALDLQPHDVVADQWVDNGPNWCALMLSSAAQVLSLRPDMAALKALQVKLGVIGPQSAGHETQFEVRAFVPALGIGEDPVTGSLNAGLSQWLIGAGLAPAHYVVSQGTVLGRQGRVHVDRVGDTIWIGGEVAACVDGQVVLP